MNEKPILVDNYNIIRSKVIIPEKDDKPEDRYEKVCQKCGNSAYPECIPHCDLHQNRVVRLD